jgi:RimJ/RimL family protein N-acetyltransferase
MSGFVAPTLEGTRVRLEPASSADRDELAELDWLRSLHPAMAGWFARPRTVAPGTAVMRGLDGGQVVGVLDAAGLPGYADVVSVSVYTDTARASGGWALEAYALFVSALFEQGVRLIHHEVLELNRPIQRILRGIGVAQTARLREHAYVAGRFWDVLVYSYDRAHWDHLLDHVVPRNPLRAQAAAPAGE